LAPWLALDLREAYVLTIERGSLAAVYCGLSFFFSIISFLGFRLNEGMPRFFSVHDALNVVKACVVAQLLTSVVVFSLTRLEGIPRTTPLIHLLVLIGGLLAARVVMLLMSGDRNAHPAPHPTALEHVIIVGSTTLSSVYINFLRAHSGGRRRAVAVLDADPAVIGRAICGVPIITLPRNLNAVIDEFAVHGVRTDRIIVGGDRQLLPQSTLNELQTVCDQRDLPLDFVSELVGLDSAPKLQPRGFEPRAESGRTGARRRQLTLNPYFRFKRLVDFFGAFATIVLLSPLFALTALIALFDVGSPVLFWQQRVGQDSCSFRLYKFRTLRAPFDYHGNRVPDDQRLSIFGRLLRALRLDELPQLFNILVGDMSLIGPRPLLPVDQPRDTSIRLAIRPGITGWAQINGGNLIDVEEKGALDEWYVRHASLWLDLRIILLTVGFIFTGEKRSESAVETALAAQQESLLYRRRFRDGVLERSVAAPTVSATLLLGEAQRSIRR
jgi:lipopolysaccharide/colanic/teichoic acid biosynthesis glycosyltransferase